MKRKIHLLLALFFLWGWPLLWASYAFAAGAMQAQSVDFFGELWTKIQQAGPFAAFFMVWMTFRSEKRSDKLQAERDGLLERVIVGLTNATNVIDKQSLVIERLLARAELIKAQQDAGS